MIHGAADAAVHGQSAADAVTAISPASPPAGNGADVGDTEKVHVGVGGGGGGGGGVGPGPGELPAACVTVTTAPAMPRLPTRLSDVVFGATANRRLPDPVSPTPPSITIQGTPETAVHEHVATEALTRTSMAPPSAPTDAASGDTVSSQPGSPGGGGTGPPITAPACSMR